MSASGKAPPLPIHEYHGERTFANVGFTYPQPSAAQSVAALHLSSFHGSLRSSGATFGSQDARLFDENAAPYLNVGAIPAPRVISYDAGKGTKDVKFRVYLSTMYELIDTDLPVFLLMFGTCRCRASLTKLDGHGGACQYVVAAGVPPFQSTGWSDTNVPVVMLMENASGELLRKVEVAHYDFTDEVELLSVASQHSYSRRHSAADSAEEDHRQKQLPTESEICDFTFAAEPSPYLLQQGSDLNMLPRFVGSRLGPSEDFAYEGRQYDQQGNRSSELVRMHQQIPNWTSASSLQPSIRQIPVHLRLQQKPSMHPLPSNDPSNPTLIRTSTLQVPSPGLTPTGNQPFNHYPQFSTKAVLKLQGDLVALSEQWTTEEWENQRRLILFRRSQSGSTITASFRSVPPDARPPNSMCISCIWWAERRECFVTSVDTIALLEHLVHEKFTVEEKNRIRRNLEGFRPLTVSKGKRDSEEFFKVVMGFPNPKPRNIEKDIKVFPWKILSIALRKIIGKYSSSPASIMPGMPPTMLVSGASAAYALESVPSHLTQDLSQNTISPPVTTRSFSHNSAAAAQILASASSSGSHTSSPALRHPLPTQGITPDSHIAGPTHYYDRPGTYQHHMASVQFSQQNLPGQASQNVHPAWDLCPYPDPNIPGTSQSQTFPATQSSISVRSPHNRPSAGARPGAKQDMQMSVGIQHARP